MNITRRDFAKGVLGMAAAFAAPLATVAAMDTGRRYDAEDDPWAAEYLRPETLAGEPIRLVRWADTRTGELGRYRADERGWPVLGPDGDLVLVVEKRPFRLVRIDTGETLAVCA